MVENLFFWCLKRIKRSVLVLGLFCLTGFWFGFLLIFPLKVLKNNSNQKVGTCL